MRAKKKGSSIGLQDIHGDDLFIGDYVRTITGRVYQINRYGNLESADYGTMNIRNAHGIELVDPSELGKAASVKKEESHEQVQDFSGLDLIPEQTELKEYNTDPNIAEAEEAEKEAAAQEQRLRLLAELSDEELLRELRIRNYSGQLKHAITVYQNVEL